MHRRSERPLAFPGDGAQDEVLAKVVVDDGPYRGGEGAAACLTVAPAPPLIMSCGFSPVTVGR